MSLDANDLVYMVQHGIDAHAEPRPGDLILFRMAGVKTPQKARLFKREVLRDKGFSPRTIYHVNHVDNPEMAIGAHQLLGVFKAQEERESTMTVDQAQIGDTVIYQIGIFQQSGKVRKLLPGGALLVDTKGRGNEEMQVQVKAGEVKEVRRARD